MKKSVLSCPSPSIFTKLLPQIGEQLEKEGFVIIEAWDIDTETLKYICRNFGRIQLHIRGDRDGIVTVAYQKSWSRCSAQDTSIQQEEFQSYDTNPILPHTDGTVIDGIHVTEDGQYVRILPPRIVIFQCVEPAESGGEIILVDAKQVLVDLLKEQQELVPTLFQSGCISFCRDDQLALDVAVFSKMPDSNISVRIHFDGRVFLPEWSYNSVKLVYKKYFSNPKYAVKIALKSKQIVLIDNRRVLHGRAPYQVYNDNNVRLHRRVWISSPDVTILRNSQNEVKRKRAFECYSPYQSLSNIENLKPRFVQCGITLNSSDREQLREILK